MDQIFDLFGDPVPLNRGKRGRPQHVPTRENRSRVKELARVGWSKKRIAAELCISKPTLRPHYFQELCIAGRASSCASHGASVCSLRSDSLGC
jgi:hypothetical protein